MKQFSKNEYLKNPERKIVTYDGRAVRIICVNRLCKDYPVVALVTDEDSEDLFSYTKEGKLYQNQDDDRDLFFVPEKKEGWVNIYKNTLGTQLGEIYNSKENAEAMAKKCKIYYITTIKIEWEE